MDFDLSPEHEMIRRTARDFAEKESRPVAAHVDKTGEFPKATIAKMLGIGFLGMAMREEYDGGGLEWMALAGTGGEVGGGGGWEGWSVGEGDVRCMGEIWVGG